MPLPPLDPREAWKPLPTSAWNADLARHLLRRAGWAARPDEVARAAEEGLAATLSRLFPVTPVALPRPVLLDRVNTRVAELQTRRRQASAPEDKRALEGEMRNLERGAIHDLAYQWLQNAADPARSAYEKWVFFLSDVYVVSSEKVRRADFIHRHFETLRSGGTGTAPDLAKAISRSPAMVEYLDLNRSSKRAPNENFARELFELFVLGEGNYSEDDIKQAARAFTGYRNGKDGFQLLPREIDRTEKILFGRRGPYTGDQVIDLAYEQPAAATFLPREMARFYLTDEPLSADFFKPLGDAWRASGLQLRELCRLFFGSTAFYHPDFRAAFIKSPVHYVLGLVQDLGLDVIPLERTTLQPLRQMGQNLFQPPNVRGWVGGRLWINSSTLAARRQTAITLCSALDESRLNADERLDLEFSRDAGRGRFTVDEERIRAFTALGPQGIAGRLCDFFLPGRVDESYRAALVAYLESAPDAADFENRARGATIAVLQSPEYQLC
jgi:uncharacterized protein (DUF1800 family)